MRDRFEIGLEREYALYAWTNDRLGHENDDRICYLLEIDRLLQVLSLSARPDDWDQMRADGWRIEPEYSKCLVEVSSPPVRREGWTDLLAKFELIDGWLAHAAGLLEDQLLDGDGHYMGRDVRRDRFKEIWCTCKYSLRTDRYMVWDGSRVLDFASLPLDPYDTNPLIGPSVAPECLGNAQFAYAGFTSINATIHPPMTGFDEDYLAGFFWRALHAARQIELAHPQRHTFLRDGRDEIAPDPEVSIRDALIRWGEPDTATLLDGMSPDWGLAEFRALFGQSPNASFSTAARPYHCRPRVVDDTMLFELRCFHSGLPLAKLAPLLEVR